MQKFENVIEINEKGIMLNDSPPLQIRVLESQMEIGKTPHCNALLKCFMLWLGKWAGQQNCSAPGKCLQNYPGPSPTAQS